MKEAFSGFLKTHFKNPDPKVTTSWECTKCRRNLNKEIIFVTEDSTFQHIEDMHLNEAINEFVRTLK